MRHVDILYNRKVIAKDAKLCDNTILRMIGLMFSKPKAAVLKASRESISGTSIHTLFMRFPLDVIWLNRSLEVVDVKRNVRPYKFLVTPKKKAMYVLEMPANKNLKVSLGDKPTF